MKFLFNNERHDDLDRVVFAQRNKDYGAYALRTEYDQILSRSLMIGVAFFAAVTVVPFAVNAFKEDPVKAPDIGSRHVFIDLPPDVIDPPKPIVQTAPAKVKTVDTTVPTPTRNTNVEKTVPTTDEIKGAAIGPETIDGPETNIPSVPYVPTTTGGGAPAISVKPPVITKDPNVIETKVDVSASFKGGLDAFRDRVGKTFDTEAVGQSGVMKATVSFVVEKDGSITNVKATGVDADFNREAERTVKSIKTKWNPAQLKGEIVRSYFNIPITMRIE